MSSSNNSDEEVESSSHSSSDEDVVSVADQLIQSLVPCDFPVGFPRNFVPRSKVDEFVTEESVSRELVGGDSELVAFVINSAKLAFAITVSSNMQGVELRNAIKRFSEKGFDDKQLPASISSKGFLTHPAFSKKSLWSYKRCRDFQQNQWMFLAPIFPRNFKTLELEPEQIFPFINVGSYKREGTFGDVYQVTIHESHQEEPMKKARISWRSIELWKRLEG